LLHADNCDAVRCGVGVSPASPVLLPVDRGAGVLAASLVSPPTEGDGGRDIAPRRPESFIRCDALVAIVNVFSRSSSSMFSKCVLVHHKSRCGIWIIVVRDAHVCCMHGRLQLNHGKHGKNQWHLIPFYHLNRNWLALSFSKYI
jgi:hypothetical protein